jgi:acyl carrier protein
MKSEEFLEELNATLETGDAGPVTLQTKFREQPWWDSLAALTVLAIFDSVYSRQLSASDLAQCETIQQVSELAEK